MIRIIPNWIIDIILISQFKTDRKLLYWLLIQRRILHISLRWFDNVLWKQGFSLLEEKQSQISGFIWNTWLSATSFKHLSWQCSWEVLRDCPSCFLSITDRFYFTVQKVCSILYSVTTAETRSDCRPIICIVSHQRLHPGQTIFHISES